MSQDLDEPTKNLLRHALYKVTCTLAGRLTSPTDARRRCSGLLLKASSRFFILSTRHSLCNGDQWDLEPHGILDADGAQVFPLIGFEHLPALPADVDVRSIPVVPLRDPHPLPPDSDPGPYVRARDLDLAFVELTEADLTGVCSSFGHPNFNAIRPNFARPEPGGTYCFGAWTQDEPHHEIRVEVREAAYEWGMTFSHFDDAAKRYVFRPRGTHKGHAYYYGASGAPIFGADKRVVALVAGGDEGSSEIFGVPLLDNLPLFMLEE